MAGNPIRRAREGRPPAPGASGMPARGGYGRPDFERGNTLALRHGAFSDRKVDPLAQALVAGLMADRPELDAYPETLRAWARAEARCLLLADWVAEHGLIDENGETPAPLKYISNFERLAIQLRSQLGLDPQSEAELARTRVDAQRGAVDLEGLQARGRAILDAREVDGYSAASLSAGSGDGSAPEEPGNGS